MRGSCLDRDHSRFCRSRGFVIVSFLSANRVSIGGFLLRVFGDNRGTGRRNMSNLSFFWVQGFVNFACIPGIYSLTLLSKFREMYIVIFLG